MRYLKFIIIYLILSFQTIFIFASENKDTITIDLFGGKGCPHCEKEKVFLNNLQNKYPFLKIKQYEIWGNKENQNLLKSISKKLNIKSSSIPITIIKNKYYIIGFQSENTTGKEIENIILKINQGNLKKNLMMTKKSLKHHHYQNLYQYR